MYSKEQHIEHTDTKIIRSESVTKAWILAD